MGDGPNGLATPRCEVGDWVEVEAILLEPAERASGLPVETAVKPLVIWVKGFAAHAAARAGLVGRGGDLESDAVGAAGGHGAGAQGQRQHPAPAVNERGLGHAEILPFPRDVI